MSRALPRIARHWLVCLALIALTTVITNSRLSGGLQPTARASATFVVTNTNDEGAGSLRQAMTDANNNPGLDTITFNIGGGGVRTINVALLLPPLTDPVVIDGTTQPGYAGAPVVELKGSFSGSGLSLVGGNSTVRGLIINSFTGYGISTGTVGGNRVEGCYIGTDVTGSEARPNGSGGVFIPGSNNVIGGTTPAARNVISGNHFAGVNVSRACCTGNETPISGNVIQGNYIGTNAAGTAPLPNAREGVRITSVNSNVPVTGNVVGGTAPGAGNVISGNAFEGVLLDGVHVAGTIIQGNFVGTDATGMFAVPNVNTGVGLSNSRNTVVGGSTPGARNVISGNGVDGSGLSGGHGLGMGGEGHVVRGNYIGTNAAANGPLPNLLDGIATGGTNLSVGGTGAGDGNLIAFNGLAGVNAANPSATNITIRNNSIFSNRRIVDANFPSLGINLGPQGVNANDAGDADTGTNGLQNFPVVASVVFGAADTRVRGTLNSTPNTTFSLDFYANSVCGALGHGEGARHFGTTPLTTDANGDAAFDATFAKALPAGQVVTATATSPSGATSEFSQCDTGALVVGSIKLSPADLEISEGAGTVTVVLSREGGPVGPLTFGYATVGGTATPGADFTHTQGTVTFQPGEMARTILIPLLDDGDDEPLETFTVTLSTTGDLDTLSSQSTTVINLFDNDATPGATLSVNDVTVTEGDSGSTDATFTATLSAAIGQTVTVDVISLSDTAGAGTDFQGISTTLTFAPGQTTRTVVVPVFGDKIYEGDETFRVEFRNPSIAVSDGVGVGTIKENEGVPSLSVNDITITEGDSGRKEVFFTVTLSGPTSRLVHFPITVTGGTATHMEDFHGDFGGGIIPPGATSTTIRTEVEGDTIDEPDETYFLDITSATDATVADGRGVATILDDEGAGEPPTVQLASRELAVAEGAGSVTVTVTRSGDASAPVTVNYAARQGTSASQSASERRDFTLALGTLRFAAGETTRSFQVLITDDAYVEGEEYINVELSAPAGGAALGSPNSGLIRIDDNDTSPSSANPIDASEAFVRQHYHDFLNREPDAGGLAFWTGGIESCGADQQCRALKRIDTSAAFFLSIEFQETGFLVQRTYKTAYGDAVGQATIGGVLTSIPVPVVRLNEFLADTQRIGLGVIVGAAGWPQRLEANKVAFAQEFVQRPRFTNAFPSGMTPGQFVDKLITNAGISVEPGERQQLLDELAANNNAVGRASVLRKIAEDPDLAALETNKAFVLMQYFGYLRRNPNDAPDANHSGYNFWLGKLNQFGGDWRQAQMVFAFIDSIEYRQRFAP